MLQKIQKRRWDNEIVEEVDEQLRNLRQLIQTGRDTLWDDVRRNVLEAWNITNINKKRMESYDVCSFVLKAYFNKCFQRAQEALYHQYTTTNDTLNDAINRVDGIDQAKPWDTETTGAKHLALGIHDAFTVNSPLASNLVKTLLFCRA